MDKLLNQLYLGVISLKNRDNNADKVHIYQFYYTYWEKYLMDVEECGKESLETKKSALLGQQHPRKRDSVWKPQFWSLERHMLDMDNLLGIPLTLYFFILTYGKLIINLGFQVS